MKNKGITLVALVVTIVIMLILAGVTLNLTLGDNGLFKMAKSAVEKYQESAQNEEKSLADLSNQINSMTNGGGTVEEMTKEEKIGMLGSYVDFGLDINNNDTTTDDWRIFYIGGITEDDQEETKGRIYIIAADYIAYTNKNKEAWQASLAKAGMQQSTNSGYGNCYLLSTPSAIDSYDGFKWVGDGNKPTQTIFPELFMGTGYYCSNHSGNQNAKTVATLQNTSFWEPFIQQSAKKNKADKAMGGPTIEMWVKSWNAMYGNSVPLHFKGEDKNSPEENQYGYYVGDPDHENYAEAYVDAADKTLYFPHTTDGNLNLDNIGENDDKCYGYWLASPSGAVDHISWVRRRLLRGRQLFDARGPLWLRGL